MSKKIPTGWKQFRLRDMLEVRDERSPNDGTLPLCSLTIKDGLIYKPDRYIREFLVKSKDKLYKKIYKDDVVFNPMNLRWGAITVSKIDEPVIASPVYQVLYLKDTELVDLSFLESIFGTTRFMNLVKTFAEGTLIERTGVNIENFLDFLMILPPIQEQRKISKTTTCVDFVINQTQAVIDQVQNLKTGLTQELLTSGIPGRHKIFRKTELGQIPRDWDVIPISEACFINPLKKELSGLSEDTEVSFLPMEGMAGEGCGIVSLQQKQLHDIGSGYTYFRDGDLLFAKITPCMENGKIGIAEGLKNSIGFGSTEFHVLRPKPNIITKDFLFHWVSRKMFRSLAANYFTGTAGQQRVQADFFSIAKIPCPSLTEQIEIARLLNFVSVIINREEERVLYINKLKFALMQVLLTGEVRVKT